MRNLREVAAAVRTEVSPVRARIREIEAFVAPLEQELPEGRLYKKNPALALAVVRWQGFRTKARTASDAHLADILPYVDIVGFMNAEGV